MIPPERSKNRFSLLNTTVPVKTTDDEELAEEAFQRVKENVQSIKERTNRASKKQIALLSALNLAGELIQQEENSTSFSLSDKTRNRMKKLKKEIEKVRSSHNDNSQAF